jgi:hypothetical protein
MSSSDPIRMPVLLSLAEQAMSDLEFRAVARQDVELALTQFGYDLNERERSLVFSFRQALEEAGIDLFLTEDFDLENIDLLRSIGEGVIEQEHAENGRNEVGSRE